MIKKTQRIHSLDSLRAIMMLLGLVLHSTETYLVGNNAPWPKDPNATSLFMNYLEYFIHMFRMPIFFMMAGFFGALLFYERGGRKMLKNRLQRIVYPFIVFLFLLAPIINISLRYSKAVFAGQENAFQYVIANISGIEGLLPSSTYHLWFLYYLVFISFVAYLLAILLNRIPAIGKPIKKSYTFLIQRPIARVLAFAVMIFILLVINWELSSPTPLSFELDPAAFLFHFFFYGMGWLLYKTKEHLSTFLKYDWLFTIAAIVLFTIEFIGESTIDDVPKGIMSAFVISMFVFGITGLFIRYFSNNSRRMRYVSDASYWIYLIHIPLTIIIPGLIAGWALPGVLKFLITLIITGIVCFITYHFLVRSTFIGKFLNGRKYPIKFPGQSSPDSEMI